MGFHGAYHYAAWISFVVKGEGRSSEVTFYFSRHLTVSYVPQFHENRRHPCAILPVAMAVVSSGFLLLIGGMVDSLHDGAFTTVVSFPTFGRTSNLFFRAGLKLGWGGKGALQQALAST